MTRAPENLLNARRLLLDHLEPHGLAPAEVGIVGDSAHRGGYHCGLDRVDLDDYSVDESPRDQNYLTDLAAGLDVGTFAYRTHNLRTFSVWCVAQCEAGAPDALNIREIIYSPDGLIVKRWDRLRKRTTGDSSHLWHTHFSFFRDSVKMNRDLRPLFRRYLTTIGLIVPPAPAPEVTDMELSDTLTGNTGHAGRTVDNVLTDLENLRNWLITPVGQYTLSAPMPDSPLARLLALAGRDFTNEPEIVSGVLAGLTPEKIAAAIPADMAKRVADELSARLAA